MSDERGDTEMQELKVSLLCLVKCADVLVTLKLQSDFGSPCINRKKILAFLPNFGLLYWVRYQLFRLYFWLFFFLNYFRR